MCQCGQETVHFANIAAVIFDKDGTLANSGHYLHQLAEARLKHLRAIAPAIEAPLRHSFGVTAQSIRADGLQAIGSREENLVAAAAHLAGAGYGWVAAREMATAAFAAADRELSPKAPFTPPFSEVIDLVKRLYEAGLILAVLSGDRTVEVEAFLHTYGLQGFFQIAMGSDCSPPKPDPTPLKKICAELKIPLAQTIVIGDADADGLMAQRAAAAGCIGVNWGWQPPPVLHYCNCTVDKPTHIQVFQES